MDAAVLHVAVLLQYALQQLPKASSCNALEQCRAAKPLCNISCLVHHAADHVVCLVPLQELGPRFTLKLQSLQKGTFDTKGGEFEWLNNKMEQKRTRFFL